MQQHERKRNPTDRRQPIRTLKEYPAVLSLGAANTTLLWRLLHSHAVQTQNKNRPAGTQDGQTNKKAGRQNDKQKRRTRSHKTNAAIEKPCCGYSRIFAPSRLSVAPRLFHVVSDTKKHTVGTRLPYPRRNSCFVVRTPRSKETPRPCFLPADGSQRRQRFIFRRGRLRLRPRFMSLLLYGNSCRYRRYIYNIFSRAPPTTNGKLVCVSHMRSFASC